MNTKGLRSLRLAPLSLAGLALAATASGCLTRPVEPLDSRTTWHAEFVQAKSGVDKIDLLLMIDNSGSMADKQAILADAVPNLVRGLLNPRCIGKDDLPIANQPASPADACPVGSAREFAPVYDVHIGIVSSSLGGHGTSACATTGPKDSKNDAGHLVARLDAATPDSPAPTYGGQGFLAWDPQQKLDPVGESSLDAADKALRDLVKGVGQIGCGYEASLESWYRFLVDPEPYKTIKADPAKNAYVREGIDEELLAERKAFLRPDSMVAILMLTDENDCSTREESFYPLINEGNYQLPRARAICETKPNDRCCAPCGHEPPDCPVDPICKTSPTLTPDEDPVNLRCWNQKKRIGWDFLYPTDRYVQALTSAKVARRDGQLVDNPLYPSDPDGKLGARVPENGLVFLAGIVGVPWQDIARQRADGTPDLVAGLDKDGNAVGGFMSAEELSRRDKDSKTSRWDVILGDPANDVPPLDKLMWESPEPRDGTNPVTGDPIAPPNASSPTANAINGHEWNTKKGSTIGDLQYACIFDLKEEAQRDCSKVDSDCDCKNADTNGGQNPLCQSPTGEYGQIQRRAKGYPGVRQLSVLKGMKDQGIVASVCPVQVSDPSRKDYGYTPAIGAIVDKLKNKLSGQCLARPLTADENGHVSCVVIEARRSEGGACCEGAARRPVQKEHEQALETAKGNPSARGADCFCEIDQLSGDDLSICQHDTSVVPATPQGEEVNGWCYVDQETGAPELVAGCGIGERYRVRFVGGGQPAKNAVTFITCAGGN